MPEPRKDKKIIFWAKGKRGHTAQGPSTCENTDRVSSLTALGVITNDKLTAANHVSSIVLRVSDYCVQYAYCTAIQYQQRNCKMFLDQLYWPNCCTVRQHMVCVLLSSRPCVDGSIHASSFHTHSYVGVSDLATVAVTRRHSVKCLTMLTNNCLSWTITYCSHTFLRQQVPSTT